MRHRASYRAISDSDRADERIAVFHGPTSSEDREAIKTAFNTDPAQSPVRILIATDAAREGLNLQAHCWNIFHFDVPWNPSRMEQRNGRIDRKLQPNPVVYCHYFFYTQRPEDRVLAAVVRKTKTIREELGSLSQVIDSKLDGLMKNGIRRAEVDDLKNQIDSADLEDGQRETVEEELEATREHEVELRAQIERLSTMLARSQESLSFSTDHFRSAQSCSLEVMGAGSSGGSDAPSRMASLMARPILGQQGVVAGRSLKNSQIKACQAAGSRGLRSTNVRHLPQTI